MSWLRVLIVLVCIFCHNLLPAQSEYSYSYTEESRMVYKNIIDLKLELARTQLDQFQRSDSKNLSWLHIANYIDFFELFISEERDQFEKLKKHQGQRLDVLDKHLSNNNPYKRFAKAEIKLQWALTKAKFGQTYKAARDIYGAYKQLEDNRADFPDFIYNYKSLSIIHSLIETADMPGIIKYVFNLDGSIELGLEEIEKVLDYKKDVAEEAYIFLEETDAIYAYILFYQANRQQEAWRFISESSLDPSTSLLSTFLTSKLAMRTGQNDLGLDFLSNRPDSEAYATFEYLDYQEGLCLLRKLDSRCVPKLENFVNNFKGQHYIKEAYQKLAWASLIFENDTLGYYNHLSQIGSHGQSLVDGDKQASKEFQRKQLPQIGLLKVRLLFDGGYYTRAAEELSALQELENSKYALEYHYRLGRVEDKRDNRKRALYHYGRTIELGKGSDKYFACNAALKTGLIYEGQNQWHSAEKYYKYCRTLYPDEYKNSLHQKAKSGQERIKKFLK